MKKVAGFLVLTLVFGVGIVANADHSLPHFTRSDAVTGSM